MVMTGRSTRTSNRPPNTPFNTFVVEKDKTKPALSPCSPHQKQSQTLPKGASSPRKQRTPRLCVRATTAKTKELLKGVLKLVKTKRTSEAADADVHHGYDARFYPCVLAEIGQNSVEIVILLVDKDCTKMFPISPYYPETAHLDKYDHVTPFFNIALIPRNSRGHVFVSKKKAHYIRNMFGKAASMKQMFQSRMFDGQRMPLKKCVGMGEDLISRCKVRVIHEAEG